MFWRFSFGLLFFSFSWKKSIFWLFLGQLELFIWFYLCLNLRNYWVSWFREMEWGRIWRLASKVFVKFSNYSVYFAHSVYTCICLVMNTRLLCLPSLLCLLIKCSLSLLCLVKYSIYSVYSVYSDYLLCLSTLSIYFIYCV